MDDVDDKEAASLNAPLDATAPPSLLDAPDAVPRKFSLALLILSIVWLPLCLFGVFGVPMLFMMTDNWGGEAHTPFQRWAASATLRIFEVGWAGCELNAMANVVTSAMSIYVASVLLAARGRPSMAQAKVLGVLAYAVCSVDFSGVVFCAIWWCSIALYSLFAGPGDAPVWSQILGALMWAGIFAVPSAALLTHARLCIAAARRLKPFARPAHRPRSSRSEAVG